MQENSLIYYQAQFDALYKTMKNLSENDASVPIYIRLELYTLQEETHWWMEKVSLIDPNNKSSDLFHIDQMLKMLSSSFKLCKDSITQDFQWESQVDVEMDEVGAVLDEFAMDEFAMDAEMDAVLGEFAMNDVLDEFAVDEFAMDAEMDEFAVDAVLDEFAMDAEVDAGPDVVLGEFAMDDEVDAVLNEFAVDDEVDAVLNEFAVDDEVDAVLDEFAVDEM